MLMEAQSSKPRFYRVASHHYERTIQHLQPPDCGLELDIAFHIGIVLALLLLTQIIHSCYSWAMATMRYSLWL